MIDDYRRSARLQRENFAALLMASMRRADSANLAKLKRAFPEVWEELETRYNSPGGLTPAERDLTVSRRGVDEP